MFKVVGKGIRADHTISSVRENVPASQTFLKILVTLGQVALAVVDSAPHALYECLDGAYGRRIRKWYPVPVGPFVFVEDKSRFDLMEWTHPDETMGAAAL